MFKKLITAAAVLVAAPVFAAPAGPFDGPFVGIQGGWQQDRQRVTIDDASGSDSFGAHRAGFAYGGQLGYDYKLSPRTVLGVEASVTGRTGRDSVTDGFGNDYSLKLGRTFDASARLGYLVTPTGLVYARGGYTNTRFILDDGFNRDSRDRGGFIAGVGYEQALTKSVSARLEYDYSGFGHDNLQRVATDLDADSVEAKYRRNAVTAGLNLHF